MDKLYWLDQIKLQDRAQVGDKAFHLSKIMQRGYPVVPGFVVSAEMLGQFLATLNSTSALVADLPDSSLHLDVANWRQLQQVAGRLRQEIITGTVPPQWVNKIFVAAREWQSGYLILRPSLALSAITPGVGNTSGLLDAIFCRCEPEAIASALKRAWSQLFRARSLLYWRRVGVNLQQINLALLVQPVENAIASGLLHAHSSGWTIEATKGLGVAISQGDVQPDVYYIQQETGVVLEQHLGNKMLAYGLDRELQPNGFDHTATVDSPKLVVTADNTDIVTYILEEAQQKQYALSEEYLQQVITLGNQLVSEIGNNFTIKWTISENNPDTNLYLTQVSSPQSAIPNLQQQYGNATPAMIKGLGASGGRVTARATVITDVHKKPEKIHKGVILVAVNIPPDWLPFLQEVAGIITVQGGLTSHAAILARELGIPAVVSALDATVVIQNGERLLVDGDRGEVYRIRGEKAAEEETQELNSPEPTIPPSPHPLVVSHLPIISTQLLVNLSQPRLIEPAQSLPVDGVGLLRSELMLLNILEGQHPQSWLLGGRQAELLEKWTEQIILFARAFAPRPVFYRSLDWRFASSSASLSHELPSSSHHQHSVQHSPLGERGTFSYVCNPAVFELELTALANVQKAGYSNINLLLPFVRSVAEFSFCRTKVEQAGLTQVPQFQLWMMAEVPSVLFLLPEYVKAGVAGISIGTNDLTQLLLGVDREQGQITRVLNERHPAVMGAIAQLIQMAKTAGIPCSICGQAPAIYPEIIDQLVEWGITSISVEPEAVDRTYRAIARAEQRLILAAARKQLQD
ncbi:putative PEP-binding protein [Nodularia sphaerocarpa]|uniref:putative PEP-binding protein n=1 Tax=Nodularia sphaerocarpa TaxID=137816 RepID=UPI001EFA6A3B|nr:putative PEP-binding protein [Nodularia sphaerocarpa]MDB9375675.1 PEP-utilizing enzyme [Nodularia sphaerocarpa CS-585]MDB9380227.1 PEP-utilizing enzyme [Nodularia sphaerocarpa CS-585A2]ULP70934.1 Phosphoenolpyruvate synthase [Nodularia sphaerocarpa UHCC 0038]